MTNTIQNATAKKEQQTAVQTSQKELLVAQIKKMEGEIKKALPSVITPERFTRMVLSAVSTTPLLAQCTTQSFFAAMMSAAQLGLEPNSALGQAFLIPFKNNKKGGIYEAQFQLGYKGMLDLAYRSGEIEIIQAHIVHENDEFDYAYGLEAKLTHKPCLGDRGKPIYVYAMFKTKNGGLGYEVMSIEDARKHGERYSKSFSSGPWQTNFEEMAKKTCIKRLLKLAPLKSEFARAIAQDSTVKTSLSADMYEVPCEEYEDMSDDIDTTTGEVKEA